MTTRPQFREGTEWRRLTATERGAGPWKYVLLEDVFFELENRRDTPLRRTGRTTTQVDDDTPAWHHGAAGITVIVYILLALYQK